jgi:predicted metal-binding protein
VDKECNGKSFTGKAQNSKQASKEKECPGCSPFFTCGSCAGFVVNKPLTVTIPVIAEVADQEYSFYHQPAIKNIPTAIWLPPKLS